ncbi:hypothetical protein LCGC14_2143090 [marine sediment metagenome]|uniref:Uncharacterized protein n=1 Tax=marine sediment metagenome TaxID=412755 RepID=A0A0F9EK12_9ZZZZ
MKLIKKEELINESQILDLVNIFVRIIGVLNHQDILVFIEIGELLTVTKLLNLPKMIKISKKILNF